MATSLLSITVIVLFTLLGQSKVLQVRAVAQVAQFIFGDSLVDQGNNNNLQSLAKANFKPNGIDLAEYNNQPTGRFCNGRLVSDFISEYMGTPSVLPYLDSNANGQNILRGCNFASAGSGILDDTGAIFVQRIPINQQIANFQKVRSQIRAQIGKAASDQLISKALFAFTTGGNDFINNYLLPASPRSQQYNIQDFTSFVVNNFQGQLKQIYSYGARKISIANIGPIGCIPDKLQSNSVDGSCVESLNQIAIGFNALLKPMLDRLAPQLPGAIITYSDSYTLVADMIQNPANYGNASKDLVDLRIYARSCLEFCRLDQDRFAVRAQLYQDWHSSTCNFTEGFTSADRACCGSGRFNGLLACSTVTSLCADRDVYLFWDPFHPTEKANEITVQKILFGPPSAITPMNISQLIQL